MGFFLSCLQTAFLYVPKFIMNSWNIMVGIEEVDPKFFVYNEIFTVNRRMNY